MRIVIVGGTGNIGTSLVRRLAGAHEVRVVARRTPPEGATLPPGVEWRSADVATDNLRPLVEDADVVVHLAWLFQPTREPDVTWHANVTGTERMLEAVAAAGTPSFVYSSSIAAYSPSGNGRPVDERAATHGAGVSAYAREKAYVERLLDAFELRNPDTRLVRIRPAFVFQQQAAAEQWRLFIAHPRLRRLFDRQWVPAVPLPADLSMQAVHADDLTEAFATAVGGSGIGAYNIAADDVLGAADLASIVQTRPVRLPSRRFRPVIRAAWNLHASKAPPDLFDTLMSLPVMSTARARQELDWRPTTSAADAVGSFLTGTERRVAGPTPPLYERTGQGPGNPDEVDSRETKADLYVRAQELDIDGRSAMNKDELAQAVHAAAGDRET